MRVCGFINKHNNIVGINPNIILIYYKNYYSFYNPNRVINQC